MTWAAKLSRWMHGRRGPHGLARWHKWHSSSPVTLTDGTLSRPNGGQLWRRKAGERWEYEQDAADEDGEPEDARRIDWE